MKPVLRLLAAAAFVVVVLRAGPDPFAQDDPPPAADAPAADAPDEAAVAPEPDGDRTSDDSTDPTASVIPVDEAVPDGKIAAKLQRILDASRWYANPRVTVREGLVTLSGKTDDQDHKEWAGQLSRRTEGVVATFNDIAVEENVTLAFAGRRVWQSVRTLWGDFLARLPLIVVGLAVLALTAVVVRLCQWTFGRAPGTRRLRPSLQDLIEQLIAVGIWVVGLLVAATVVFPGMTPAKALTVLGLSSVAIGFAFKDIFENFLAGILILWRFPIDRGDFIECADVAGKIQQITVRNTLVRQVDGTLVIAPNGLLFKNPVKVLTNWKSRRITVTCGIAYGEDVDRGREVIKAAVEACGTVEHRKPVEIFAHGFGESSIDFEVTWWSGPTPLEERHSRDEVVAAVKRALDAAGIEIPFPYRTLTFKEPLRTVAANDDAAS